MAACFLQDRQSLENAGSFRNFTLILNFTTETNWNNLLRGCEAIRVINWDEFLFFFFFFRHGSRKL